MIKKLVGNIIINSNIPNNNYYKVVLNYFKLKNINGNIWSKIQKKSKFIIIQD